LAAAKARVTVLREQYHKEAEPSSEITARLRSAVALVDGIQRGLDAYCQRRPSQATEELVPVDHGLL